MSDRVQHASGGYATASSSASPKPRRRIFSLLIHGKEIFLREGTLVVGRALSCDIVLNDRLVSREHARLIVRESSAALSDLGSTNGAFVNEQRVMGTVELQEGDLIIIGNQEMTLRCAVSDDERPTSPGRPAQELDEISEVIERQPPSSGRARIEKPIEASTEPGQPPPSSDGVLRAQLGSIRVHDARSDYAPHMTEKADALQVLGRLADRAMVMGNYEGAERVLESHLDNLLAASRNDVVISDAQMEAASRYALRLADALQKAKWVDFAVELHLIAGKVMCDWCTTRLALVAPTAPGIDQEQLFFYQEMLKAKLAALSDEERARAEQIIEVRPKR